MPRVPDFTDLNRARRSAASRLSYRNVYAKGPINSQSLSRGAAAPANNTASPQSVSMPAVQILAANSTLDITGFNEGTIISENEGASELVGSLNANGILIQVQEVISEGESYLSISLPNGETYQAYDKQKTTIFVNGSSFSVFYDKDNGGGIF
jgi:hypothetical protein